jgi:NAD dependent epimerase/dehydratase family enzyme
MMQSLAECAKRPLLLSMPEWAAKTLMGEVSTLVLDSRNVVPKRLLQANYTFTFPTIQKALQNLCETKT